MVPIIKLMVWFIVFKCSCGDYLWLTRLRNDKTFSTSKLFFHIHVALYYFAQKCVSFNMMKHSPLRNAECLLIFFGSCSDKQFFYWHISLTWLQSILCFCLQLPLFFSADSQFFSSPCRVLRSIVSDFVRSGLKMAGLPGIVGAALLPFLSRIFSDRWITSSCVLLCTAGEFCT